jgi:uncharacterized protein (TIGR01319 family)
VGAVALADFGSTYTKLALVEVGEGRLLAHAEAPTTAGTDLMRGYEQALARAFDAAGGPVPLADELAASSAGGGLRVAAIGLVADLTGAAARQAALNAGARVEAVLAGSLGEGEIERLHRAEPEIIVFAGGTDGGQAELVLANARRLASHPLAAHVVVACNREIAEPVAATLEVGGMTAEVAANVMPVLGELEIEPARQAILRAFLAHVIGGKGLSGDPRFGRMVKMPTPEAVLEATRLLATGGAGGSGLGAVMAVDVGGATTDVHSHRSPVAAGPGIEEPLLPPPATLRTVEGDLGLRAGASGALDADRRLLVENLKMDEAEIGQSVLRRSGHPEWIPEDPKERQVDFLLALNCATEAIARHCGTMLLSRGPDGVPKLTKQGADLREVDLLIGTGGVLAHRSDAGAILSGALARPGPRSLVPRAPELAIDRSYVLAAAGLLARIAEAPALQLLRREVVAIDV